jgi:hypothetical protein
MGASQRVIVQLPVIWVDADDGVSLADLVRAMMLQLTVDREEVPGRLIDSQLLLRIEPCTEGVGATIQSLPEFADLAERRFRSICEARHERCSEGRVRPAAGGGRG